MEDVDGARSFDATGESYDSFMGRYSKPLAECFADAAGVRPGQSALDVGCGPGALTGILTARLGSGSVAACDPSPAFAEACRSRYTGVDVRSGRAENLPFETDRFDQVLAQLVMHFVSDPAAAIEEFVRVARPGGTIGACVWDFDHGMEMLRRFWDAALAIDPAAPDEARTMKFGREGELVDLFEKAGLRHPKETTLRVVSTYGDFDELWSGLCAGIGPAGTYCVSLSAPMRNLLRSRLFHDLGQPTAAFSLSAVARCAVATAP
ncbi:MAG: class I SAM-dependent methyltransferase [Acidimicrobiia bacterium]|nr:class I SAM-dependent methyltransferase [Acidimicrobiia bacterium]